MILVIALVCGALAGLICLAFLPAFAPVAALTAASIPLAARAITSRPGAAASLLVQFLWIATIPLGLAQAIASDRNRYNPNLGSAIVALFSTGLLVAVLSYRAPLGTPWKTAASGLGCFWIGVIAGVTTYPGNAYTLGYVGIGIAVAFRYGARSVAADLWQQTKDTVRRWTGTPPDDIERWREGSLAERETALLLDRWRRDQTGYAIVLHDRTLPERGALGSAPRGNVDHLIVSRHGVVLIDSAIRRGPVLPDGTAPEDLDDLNGPQATGRRAAAVADLLGVPVQAVIVEHRADLAAPVIRITAGTGEVTMISPAALIGELNRSDGTLTDRQTKRLARRARRYLPVERTAPTPQPSRRAQRRTQRRATQNRGTQARSIQRRGPRSLTAAPQGMSTPVDTTPEIDTTPHPTRIAPGKRVMLTSDDGVFCDMRAATGVLPGPDGNEVVYVCGEAEWYEAGREQRPPRIKPWPIERVTAE